jgi:signal transduction histidine kinase
VSGRRKPHAGVLGVSDASRNGLSHSEQGPAVEPGAALFEHAPQPMAAARGTDAPRIQIVNRAYLEQFDGRRREGSDRGAFERHAELSPTERDIVRTAAAGGIAADSVTKRTPDGRREFKVRAIPADRADVTAYLQYRDVTVRRIRDQQLAVLRRILRHDLRNDLTVLLGYAQTIAEESDDPASREDAATMIEAAGDLRAVAESAGRMQCITDAPRSTPLGDAIARVRRSIEPSLEGRFEIDGTVPSRSVDGRVAVALEELCRTFADDCETTEITIAAAAADGWITLDLETDGTLCEQERSALEGRDETQLRHATGISPWISRWAVRAAGGRMQVEQRDGRCRVTVAVRTLEGADERPMQAALSDG